LIYLHCIFLRETADGFQILKMKTSASKFGIWTQGDRTKASGDSLSRTIQSWWSVFRFHRIREYWTLFVPRPWKDVSIDILNLFCRKFKPAPVIPIELRPASTTPRSN
jgi:hypothetical protein